jgi:hypothetical protein
MATARAQRIPLDHCQLHVGDKQHGVICSGTATWSLESGFNAEDAIMLVFYKGDDTEPEMGNQGCVGFSVEQAQFLGEYLLNRVQACQLDRRLGESQYSSAPRNLVQVPKPAH